MRYQRWPTRARALAVGVLLIAGCGGPITDDELGRGIESLGSDAAEGALIADGVARDRTKATFVRVQSRTLAERVDHEAEKLNDARARRDNAAQKDRAVALAGRISSVLGDLEVSPGDERTGREAKRRLNELADDASRLAGSL